MVPTDVHSRVSTTEKRENFAGTDFSTPAIATYILQKHHHQHYDLVISVLKVLT